MVERHPPTRVSIPMHLSGLPEITCIPSGTAEVLRQLALASYHILQLLNSDRDVRAASCSERV